MTWTRPRLQFHATRARLHTLVACADSIWRGAGYGMVLDELDAFRDRGMRILILGAWNCTVVMAVIGWWCGNPRTPLVVALAVAANLLPTLLVRRKRRDRSARLVVGTLAAIHPALAVFLLHEHGWQSYADMYAFVALAALVVLCDWRPIAMAAILHGTHHLVSRR